MVKGLKFVGTVDITKNMDYKLAKELKDAGFPLRIKALPVSYMGKDYQDFEHPTLSELIEACGDVCLLVRKGKEAKASNYKFELENKYFYGSTPEEAVARLWLELNKKPTPK